MSLAFAMSIVGLNPEEFKYLIAKLTPETKLRNRVLADRPVSPIARSECSSIYTPASSMRTSDGVISPWSTPFSSRAPSIRSTTCSTPSLTPTSSRPTTPTDEIWKTHTESVIRSVNGSKIRDLLDLSRNLKDPRWKIKHPMIHGQDFQSFLNNEPMSGHSSKKCTTDEFPMRCCKDCTFSEPSPYLFGELYQARLSLTGETKWK